MCVNTYMFIYTYDSPVCWTWLIHVCHTPSLTLLQSLASPPSRYICMTRLVRMWYVWHELFMCVTRRHWRASPEVLASSPSRSSPSCACHDLLVCVTWFTLCDMSSSMLLRAVASPHSGCICVAGLAGVCVLWRTRVSKSTRLYVYTFDLQLDVLVCATWFIHVWHDIP